MPAPSFVTRRTDRESYRSYFTDDPEDDGVVSFANLGGDATLVVPSSRGPDENYGHLAAFVRGAPRDQVRSLWRRVGQVASEGLGRSPVWISTAGGGVAWLHVRFDRRPKYYGHAPYREP